VLHQYLQVSKRFSKSTATRFVSANKGALKVYQRPAEGRRRAAMQQLACYGIND